MTNLQFLSTITKLRITIQMEWVKEVGIPEAIKQLLEGTRKLFIQCVKFYPPWGFLPYFQTMAELSGIKLDLEEAYKDSGTFLFS